MTAAAIPTETRGVTFPVAESAAREADVTFGPFVNVHGARALILIIEATAEVDTASVVFTIQGIDTVTGVTWDILAAAAITATGSVVLRVSPDLTASANLIAKDHVPYTWQVVANHDDADDLTYQIQAQYVG